MPILTSTTSNTISDKRFSGVSASGHESPSGLLSIPELYVLLSAILLHDIGRGTGGGDDHASKSLGIVVEKHAHLGIPSRELAKSIGAIAAAHGYSPVHPGRQRSLPTIVIDPYGQIRQEPLAALLRLVDHMDSAYTRVVPQYVVPENELEILGQFRNVVLGVVVDHGAHMVRTVISREKFEQKERRNAAYSIVQPYDEACHSDWEIICEGRELPPDLRATLEKLPNTKHTLPKRIAKTITGKRRDVQKKHREARRKDTHWESISKELNDKAGRILACKKACFEGTSLLPDRILHDKARSFGHSDWLVARRFFQVHPGRTTPPHALLAVVMGDALANARELAASKAELASVGLPVAAWLIDFEEHLYNTWGEETYEPIFTKQFLRRIAKGMWELSTRVFGFSLFTYVDLAAYVGESDVTKVYRAIRRISIVTQQSKTIDDKSAPAVWIGASDWKWNVSHPQVGNDERCSFVHVDVVHDAIEALGDPRDERV